MATSKNTPASTQTTPADPGRAERNPERESAEPAQQTTDGSAQERPLYGPHAGDPRGQELPPGTDTEKIRTDEYGVLVDDGVPADSTETGAETGAETGK